jgi:hypothetical protein
MIVEPGKAAYVQKKGRKSFIFYILTSNFFGI